ncbi:hypothetical protein [Legionella jordanis]|uniref:HEAT repeat domain-containing protein n=1 Tax=Legionella jordanis TaxID=456 RepID=A0A0W0VBB5_9GAMM|nr:hypothetical protein [Legionella jordanis]KTD17391.1 hypothetical protein Ljor_1697 [Legionella jordanis]RMX01843.1 hypothetical protein EAW55_10070 [Legionella jordanis]RMX17633.1 hypothetical protein EAS68_10085 [Legionella jordanis]VEH11588.1 Uncharacterised protein [Legionella jordanis]
MNKIFKILILTFYFNDLFSANAIIDLYGVDEPIASKIIRQSNANIQRYVEMESNMGAVSPDKMDDALSKHLKLHDQIINQIKKYGDFSFVDISIIYYPDKNTRYTTIDIVPSSEMFRIPNPPKRKIDKELVLNTETKNLFKLWSRYNEDNISLINKGTFSSKQQACPVVHCIWGFDKKELNEYLPKFRTLASKNINQLKNFIRLSSNDEERGDAIFLLAHSDDYRSTASFLFDYVNDESAVVRNNSLRVIAGILSTHKIDDLPLQKIIEALNYPLVTDRNKAANVLYHAAHNDATTHEQIITGAGNILVNLLKLKQPNNHNPAYLTLKEISHQNYSEYDYQHWQEWIDSRKNELNKPKRI